jgi:putative ABC transport system permease protein
VDCRIAGAADFARGDGRGRRARNDQLELAQVTLKELVNRLVFENLKHRPVRTLLSAVAIGVQVTLILTLVGVSDGMLGDVAKQRQGTGADVVVRPPDSSVINFSSGGTMSEKIVDLVRQQPHITLATGSLIQNVGLLESITGIHLDEFNQLSGGLKYLHGGPFHGPDDVVIDDVEARARHAQVGQMINNGKQWRVSGIVESGKMSRMFTDIKVLQELYTSTGKISVIWVKVDNPNNVVAVKTELESKLPDYKVYSMEEMVSLISADSIPLLKTFTYVIICLAVIGGFLVVSLSMYMAVLERTREIGILKALGASPGYIVDMLMRETVLLAIAGTIAGILMSYGTTFLMNTFVPTMATIIVPGWWKWAALIALTGSLIGALFPGLKAAKQDAIEALSYD